MQTTSLPAKDAANVESYSLLLTTLLKKKQETITLADASYALVLTLSCYDIYASATRHLPRIRPAATAAKMLRNFI